MKKGFKLFCFLLSIVLSGGLLNGMVDPVEQQEGVDRRVNWEAAIELVRQLNKPWELSVSNRGDIVVCWSDTESPIDNIERLIGKKKSDKFNQEFPATIDDRNDLLKSFLKIFSEEIEAFFIKLNMENVQCLPKEIHVFGRDGDEGILWFFDWLKEGIIASRIASDFNIMDTDTIYELRNRKSLVREFAYFICIYTALVRRGFIRNLEKELQVLKRLLAYDHDAHFGKKMQKTLKTCYKNMIRLLQALMNPESWRPNLNKERRRLDCIVKCPEA